MPTMNSWHASQTAACNAAREAAGSFAEQRSKSSNSASEKQSESAINEDLPMLTRDR